MYIGISDSELKARTKQEKMKSMSLNPKIKILMDFITKKQFNKNGVEYYEKMFYSRLRPLVGHPLKIDNEVTKIINEIFDGKIK